MPFFGVATTIIVVGVTLFVMFRVFGGLLKGSAERDRLLRVGWPARARVLNVQMGGMTVTVGVDRQLQLVIQAEVQGEGRAPYPAQITALVSELQIPQVQPGSWLAVRVDPMNPSNIVIEATGVGPPGSPGPGMAPGGYGNAPPMGQGFGAPQAGFAPGYGAPAYGAPAYGAPGYGAPGYGNAPGASGVGAGNPWGAPRMEMPIGTPVRGFRMPLGAKIGLGIGLVGALVGIGVAVWAVSWTSGIGSPSAVCEKAAKCCRKMAGSNNASCENFLKQTGPIADTVCEESLKSFKETKSCK